MRVPASSKPPLASWPRGALPEYVFSVRGSGGALLGIDVSEFDWTLEVNSKLGTVAYEAFRSISDMPGEPSGVFRYAAADSSLAELLEVLEESDLGRPTAESDAHPAITSRTYYFHRPPGDPIYKRINTRNEIANAGIAQLRYRINALIVESLKHPERALKTEIRTVEVGQMEFRFDLAVTNVGIEPVCFADPRSVVSAGASHRALVLVTSFPEAGPADPPPFFEWEEIKLEPLNAGPDKEPIVTLGPGETWNVATKTWKPKSRMRHLAYFTWANYRGEAFSDGIYRVRGRVDSPRIVINP